MMKHLLVAAFLTISSSSAFAEPIGRWWHGYGQGTNEYGIKNDSAGSDTVYIACSADSTTVRFSVGGVDPQPQSNVVVVIGGEEWELDMDTEGLFPTDNHVAADNFISLWKAMRRRSAMRVRLESGQSTVFTLRGAARVLGSEPCETDFYDR
jgi:hypothetical protein